MAVTTNLDITKIESQQEQQDVIANQAFDKLDSAIAGRLSKSVAGGSNVTLTATEALNAILEFTGALTANINVIVPTKNKIWIVFNNTTGAFTLTLKTSAGTGIAVAQTKRAQLYCDATNVVRATADV